MNKVILIGRLTKNVELKYTQQNLAVAQFTIAVNRPYNPNKQQQEVDFISCIAWRKLAENLSKYCRRGSQIAIEGRIQTRNYIAQDGSKRYITEVLCENITYLDNKSKTEGQQVLEQIQNNETTNSTENAQVQGQVEDPFQSFGEEIELSEEDLPF